MKSMSSKDFIPAKESAFAIRFFTLYGHWLIKRRFHRIWLSNEYLKEPDAKTVYYLNHTMWWDGLLPLLLNGYHFHQKARALMEDTQMKKHTFFSRIGAFSINLNDPRSAIFSLRYAVKSMQRDNACLFIYPEGELVTSSDSKPEFKDGLAWLASKLPEVDFVPIGIHQSFHSHSKPELFVSVGEATPSSSRGSREEKTLLFEETLYELLTRSKRQARNPEKHFSSFF